MLFGQTCQYSFDCIFMVLQMSCIFVYFSLEVLSIQVNMSSEKSYGEFEAATLVHFRNPWESSDKPISSVTLKMPFIGG